MNPKSKKDMKEMKEKKPRRYIDYKDTELLKKFLNPHARILGKKKSDISSKEQREIALAIKRARFMGFLPFVAR